MADKETDIPEEGRATVVVHGDHRTNLAVARRIHGGILAGTAYNAALSPQLADKFNGANISASSVAYAEDLLERMAPRDPMEEMLVNQALLAYARVMHLSSLANQQTTLDAIRIVNEYADRASIETASEN